MRQRFLAIVLILLAATSAFADALSTRRAAEEAFLRGDTLAGRKLLTEAAEEARGVEDAYARLNELRYIAQLADKEGKKMKARALFEEAAHTSLDITPVFRKLSGMIAVLELQQATGDKTGLRDNALLFIDSGIFEEQAKTGAVGEIPRLIAVMKDGLTREDVDQLKARVKKIDAPAFTQRVLYRLGP